jgi:hypothetical protein
MGSIEEFAQVTIDPAAAIPTLPDPGIAMFLSGTAYAGAGTGWNTGELARAYDNLTAVAADWGATTSEYLAGAAWFAQEPARKFIVGKLSVAPATKYIISYPQLVASTVYPLKVNGNVITPAATDGTPTGAEIATLQEALIDALAISGVTSTVVGSTLEIDATAGKQLYVELTDANGVDYGPGGLNYMAMKVTGADPATPVATQIGNIRVVQDSWYFLLNPFLGEAYCHAIAAYLLSIDQKCLLQVDPTSGAAVDAVGLPATDLGFDLKGLSNSRAAVFYSHKPVAFLDAAAGGSRAGRTPGTYTFGFASLKGIPATKITDTHRTNLKAKNINWYEGYGSLADGSDAIASLQQGKVASGMWLDERVYRDSLRARLQVAAYGLLTRAGAAGGKVRGDDKGILSMYGALRDIFEEDVKSGALTSYTLTPPLQKNRTQADKDARICGDFQFTAVYSSAIHKVTIRGAVTV